MVNTYLVFEIQAYKSFDETNDVMTDLVILQLIAKNEKDAVKKAKKLIKKNGYRLSKVIEKQHGT